jgi:hypothetical protein
VPDLKSANASPPAETTLTSATLEAPAAVNAEAPRARAVLVPKPAPPVAEKVVSVETSEDVSDTPGTPEVPDEPAEPAEPAAP